MPRRKSKRAEPPAGELPMVALSAEQIEAMLTIQVVVGGGLVFAAGQFAAKRGSPHADKQLSLTAAVTPQIEALVAAIAAHLGVEVYKPEAGDGLLAPLDGPTPSAPPGRVGRA